MKAASEFVLALLVLVILVSLVTLLWLYYYGYLRFIESKGDTTGLGEVLSSCMNIDSVIGNSTYLRNCGTGVIKNDTLAVFIDEQYFDSSESFISLDRGEVGTVNIDLSSVSLGGHWLRITTKAAEAERYVNLTMISGLKSMRLLEFA